VKSLLLARLPEGHLANAVRSPHPSYPVRIGASDSYTNRTTSLRGDSNPLTWGTTVHDNYHSNTLNGNANPPSSDELDWFFASQMDTINNLLQGEQVN
jgi:hypothetical protein